MKRRTLSTARSRAELIASYAYGASDPYWALLSKAERDKAASSGAAMPDGSYPILTCEGDNSVDSAIHAVGRGSGSHNAIRKHIIKRAKSLGCSAKIPDNWNDDGSLKGGATSISDVYPFAGHDGGHGDGNEGNAKSLIRWFNEGADGKIEWGTDGDFDRCVAIARPHLSDPQGFCQERHMDATGHPAGHAPGESKHSLAAPVGQPAAKPVPGAVDDADVDQQVSAAISEMQAALDKAIAAQKKDPDATTDKNDQQVTQGLSQIADLLATVTKAQTADSASDSSEPKPPAKPDAKPAVTAAGAAPAAPPASPVSDNGDVADDVKCANPDCQHLAKSHLDSDTDGKNTGACQMSNCDCLGMQVDSEPNTGSGDKGDDVGGQQDLAADAPGNAVPDAPAPPGKPAAAKPSGLNEPPQIPGGENMGPAFTIPVAIIEGQPTSDGRQIAPGALGWRVPPVPLMGLATETHDPEGFDLNSPSVLCGRIDGFKRSPGEGGTQIISAFGYFLPNDDGMYFSELAQAMGRIGVSADVAVEASEVEVGEVDPMGFPIEMSETLTQGTIMGLTVVPFPAFEGAYLVLGDGSEKPAATAIPQQADEPATPEKPPAAVTAGGQLVHLMSYEECAACDQGIEVMVASGQGPTRPPAAWFSNPNFHPEDGRMVEILDRRGNRVIGGKFACPLTIEDTGRVYGHIAPWGVCHTGVTGQCIVAPRSNVDYAHFKRGQHVVTAEGERLRVGVLTCDAGHAPQRGITASQAMAHYDNTALAVADVNIGEDEHGIWVAGAMRPDATEEQIRALRASSISGDWRQLGGNLELVAALAVNQPGFPLAVVAAGRHEALIAAGASVMDRVKHPAPPEAPPEGDSALRAALGPLLGDAKAKARERLAALR